MADSVPPTPKAPVPVLPPLDKMFLIGIWVETVFYGMNCLVFASALYVLIKKQQANWRPLLGISILGFILSTCYVSISLRQLLEAFIYGPPGKATLYFAKQAAKLPQSKLGLYVVNVSLQNQVLIWRLWTVFGKSWKVLPVPIILEVTRVCAAAVAMWKGGQPGTPIFDPLVHNMGVLNWTLDLALNIGVTAAIVGRIWWMGRYLSSVRNGRGNGYMGVVWTIVESGMMFTTATIITVAIYLSGNIAAVVAIDSTVQLATITPLLIIVRVGFGLTHGENQAKSNTAYSSNYNTTAVRSDAGVGSMTFASSPAVHVKVTKTDDYDADGYPLGTVTNDRKWDV